MITFCRMSTSIKFLEAKGFYVDKRYSYFSILLRKFKSYYELKKKNLYFNLYQKEKILLFDNRCDSVLADVDCLYRKINQQESSDCASEVVSLKVSSN